MLYLQIVAGLIVLVIGAELLVRAASTVALRLGVSSLIVSLTLVGIGTSAPEVFVTVQAAATGRTDLALGNVIGSNVANVGLVIGICGLFRVLTAGRQLLRFDVPAVILMTTIVGGLAMMGGGLSRTDGVVVLLLFAAYLARTVSVGMRESRETAEPRVGLTSVDWIRYGAVFAAGLGGLILGSRWLVEGASEVAIRFGMPEALVGSTIVAIGTSLPEVATSLVATLRNQLGVAIGNAVGSCIANLGLVLGTGCLAAGSMTVPDSLIHTEVPVALAISVVLLIFLATQRQVIRAEAWMLLLGYLVYLVLVGRGSATGALLTWPILLVTYAALLLTIVGLDLRRRPPIPD